MQHRFTLIKNTKSKKYITLFFAFVFCFFYFTLNTIKFYETVAYYGYTKDTQKPNYIYAVDSGIVLNILVSNNEIIFPSQKLFSIKKNNTEDKMEEHFQFYEGDIPIKIKAIYINKSKEVIKNQKIIELKNNSENLYIESFVPESIIQSIKKNNEVILNFDNNNANYSGIIEDINPNIFTKDEINSFSGFDFNYNGYKVKIRILTSPNNLREGHKVNFKIMKKKQTITYFFMKKIRSILYDF